MTSKPQMGDLDMPVAKNTQGYPTTKKDNGALWLVNFPYVFILIWIVCNHSTRPSWVRLHRAIFQPRAWLPSMWKWLLATKYSASWILRSSPRKLDQARRLSNANSACSRSIRAHNRKCWRLDGLCWTD